MDLLEHESAATFQNIYLAPHVIPNLFRKPFWQDPLCVTSPAPKHHLPTELPLEALNIHPAATDLHRIDGVKTGFDQIWKKFAHATAAMEHHFDAGELLRAVPHRSMPGFEELTIHGGRNLGTALHAEIVAENDNVNTITDEREKPLEILHVPFDNTIQKCVCSIGIFCEEEKKSVVPVQELAHLQQIPSEESENCTIGLRPKLPRSLT